jgi:O-antigen/teichoic acid export membrane protein
MLVLFFYDIPVGRRRAGQSGWDAFRPIWDKRTLRSLAWQALPLAFATVLVMIAQYLPRLVVEEALGLKALGFFAALLALAMAPSRLVHSMGMAVSVRLARHYAAGQIAPFVRLLGRIVLGVAAIGTLGVVLGAMFGEQLLSVIYTPEYAEHADLLVWLIAAACLRFVADVLQFGMIAARRFWWLTLQYGVVATVAIVSCYAIIPQYGLNGAGVVMFLIFLSQLIVIGAGLLYSLAAARARGVAR